MRIDQATVLRYRALFGAGFLVLGIIVLVRVVTAPAPPSSKVLGGAFALATIALGTVRLVTFAKARGVGKS